MTKPKLVSGVAVAFWIFFLFSSIVVPLFLETIVQPGIRESARGLAGSAAEAMGANPTNTDPALSRGIDTVPVRSPEPKENIERENRRVTRERPTSVQTKGIIPIRRASNAETNKP